MDRIINLRFANRGVGATAMGGAVRARLLGNLDNKISRAGGSEVPDGSYKTGGAPQVIIETENLADVVTAMSGLMDEQVLLLGYNDGSVNGRLLTVKFCTATNVGNSEFPPAEGSGNVPRYQITFDVHQGTLVTTLAEAFVDSAQA